MPHYANARIAGAAFDVFQTDPLPPGSPFWTLPNVFITPHVGGYIVEYEEFITPHVGGYIVEYEEFIMPLILDNMRLFLGGRADAMANIVAR